jgi:hypothetical protein
VVNGITLLLHLEVQVGIMILPPLVEEERIIIMVQVTGRFRETTRTSRSTTHGWPRCIRLERHANTKQYARPYERSSGTPWTNWAKNATRKRPMGATSDSSLGRADRCKCWR